MSRINVFVAVLFVAAVTVLAPSQSSAAITSKAQVAIAGSTGVWQAMGLGAFNQANQGCPSAGVVVHPPCFHYTDNTKFNLEDTRPDGYVGGAPIYDTADLWIIWDSPTTGTRNVWYYIKPDTIIANKCYWANPRCRTFAPSGYVWTTVGQIISSGLWGADTVPPVDVQNLFLAGSTVNTLMSEVRPEDALFEQCRVNSALGNGTKTTADGLGDGTDGLGYGTNPSGTCPSYAAGGTAAQLALLEGSNIKSGINDGAGHFSTAASFVAAFNISGTDPFTNSPVVAATEYNIGIFPIVFVYSNRTGAFDGVSDATDAQLQSVFSGADCGSGVFAGATKPSPINAWLREPLSGTMTTTELGLFRRQLETTPAWATANNGAGVNLGSSGSQELGVGANNPLNLLPCSAGGGTRNRGIGTGEVINGAKVNGNTIGGVLGSGLAAPYTNDGIGYMFWSFGNASKLVGTSFGFLSLDGEDPLGLPGFAPGGVLPTSVTFPASEASLWPPVGGILNSYPNVRDGKYTTWTNVRMFTSAGTNGKDLVSTLFTTVVNTAPDFIPAETTTDSNGNVDPGEQIWHTRFQQRDADGNALGSAPTNGSFTTRAEGCNPKNTDADKGGEAGGCTISTILSATKCIAATTDKNQIQIDVTEVGGSSVSNCKTDRN
ncbi:MAG: hypothetical protein ACLPN2_00210 [Terriglobales bacterium]